MRAALMLIALLLCVASACSNAPGGFTYYEKGKFVTEPADTVRSREAAAVAAGEDTWRSEPAYVAAAMRPGLPKPGNLESQPGGRQSMAAYVPPPEVEYGTVALTVTRGTHGGKPSATVTCQGRLVTEYAVMEQQGDRAVVQATIRGEPQHRLVLERPFGHWWYVTQIEPVRPTLDMLSTAGRVVEAEAQEQLSPNHWLFRMTDARLGLTHEWYPPDYFVAWWHNDFYYGDLSSFGAGYLPFNAMFLEKGRRYVVVMDESFRPALFYPVEPKASTYVGKMTKLEFGDCARGAMDLRGYMRGLLRGLREPDARQARRRSGSSLEREHTAAMEAFLRKPVMQDLRTDEQPLMHILAVTRERATVLVPLRDPREHAREVRGNVGIFSLRRVFLTMGSPSWQITGFQVKQQEKQPDLVVDREEW